MDSSIQAMVDRIRTVMAEEKVTAVQLASMTGVSLSTLGKVLRLETKEPSVSLAIEVAKALGVSADWLLGLSEYRNSIEEIELSSEKENGSKDSLAIEVYRKFCECSSQYKSFYAECFGVAENDEFQPPMCEIIFDHIIGVLRDYLSLAEDIISCNNDESFKKCVLSINDKISERLNVKAQLIEEAYRLYTERSHSMPNNNVSSEKSMQQSYRAAKSKNNHPSAIVPVKDMSGYPEMEGDDTKGL